MNTGGRCRPPAIAGGYLYKNVTWAHDNHSMNVETDCIGLVQNGQQAPFYSFGVTCSKPSGDHGVFLFSGQGCNGTGLLIT